MKKIICMVTFWGSLLNLHALQLSQYHKYQLSNKEDFSKNFDKSTDLIRGIVALREGVLDIQRLYGNIDFTRMKINNFQIYSYEDRGQDAMTQLLILTHPSAGGAGFNAEGSGSIGQLFCKKITKNELENKQKTEASKNAENEDVNADNAEKKTGNSEEIEAENENKLYNLDVIKIISTMFKLANKVRSQATEVFPNAHNKNLRDEIRAKFEENIFEKIDAINKLVFNGPNKTDKNDPYVEALRGTEDLIGKTYKQLADAIRALGVEIENIKSEKELNEKKFAREKIGLIREKEEEQLAKLDNFRITPNAPCSEHVDAANLAQTTSNVPDSKYIEAVNKALDDIKEVWSPNYEFTDITDIKDFITDKLTQSQDVVRKLKNAVGKNNVDANLKSFFGEYTSFLNSLIIEAKGACNSIAREVKARSQVKNQERTRFRKALNYVIKRNIDTIAEVTNLYGIALDTKDQEYETKIKKLVDLTEAVAEAVLLERFSDENSVNDEEVEEYPYWLGYTNDIICAYACSTISGEFVEDQLKKLGELLGGKDSQGYISDLTTVLYQERKNGKSVIPFDVGVTPITNAFTTFRGQSYADCVETTMRQFFAFIFSETIWDTSKQEANTTSETAAVQKGEPTGEVTIDPSRIPEGPLKDFFIRGGKIADIQSLANDSSAATRAEWSHICGGHNGIWYLHKSAGGYELQPDWNNMIKLFCLLMKGYPDMVAPQKNTEKTVDNTKAAEDPRIKAAELIRKINKDPNYQLEDEGENSLKNVINTLLGIRTDIKFQVTDYYMPRKIKTKGGYALIGPVEIAPACDEKFNLLFQNNKMRFEVQEKHAFLHRIEGKKADRSTYTVGKSEISGYNNIENLYKNRGKAFSKTDSKEKKYLYPVLNYYNTFKKSAPKFYLNLNEMLRSGLGREYLNGIAKIMLGDRSSFTNQHLIDQYNATLIGNFSHLLEIFKKSGMEERELIGPTLMKLNIQKGFNNDEDREFAGKILNDLFEADPSKVEDYIHRIYNFEKDKPLKPFGMSALRNLKKYKKYADTVEITKTHKLDFSKLVSLTREDDGSKAKVYIELAKDYPEAFMAYVNSLASVDTTFLLEELATLIEGVETEYSELLKKIDFLKAKIDKISAEIIIKNNEIISVKAKISSLEREHKSETSEEKAKREKDLKDKKEELKRSTEEKDLIDEQRNELNVQLNNIVKKVEAFTKAYSAAFEKIVLSADLNKLSEKDFDLLRNCVNKVLEAQKQKNNTNNNDNTDVNAHLSITWREARYVDDRKIELLLPITTMVVGYDLKKVILSYLMRNKAEKYTSLLLTSLDSSDNKFADLDAWFKQIPPTEDFLLQLAVEYSQDKEVIRCIANYYKDKEFPMSIALQILQTSPKDISAQIVENIDIEKLTSNEKFVEKVMKSDFWKEKSIGYEWKEKLIKDIYKQCSISDFISRTQKNILFLPLSEEIMCSWADAIYGEENEILILKKLVSIGNDAENEKQNCDFILKKVAEKLKTRYENERIPLCYAQYMVSAIAPEELSDFLSRVDINWGDTEETRKQLQVMIKYLNDFADISKVIENWIVPFFTDRKISLDFATIISKYFTAKILDLVDWNITDFSKLDKMISTTPKKSAVLKRITDHYKGKIPFDVASKIIKYVAKNEIRTFLNNIKIENEEEFIEYMSSFLSSCGVGPNKQHQITLYIQEYFKNKGQKIPGNLSVCIIERDTDICSVIDDFSPEYKSCSSYKGTLKIFLNNRSIENAEETVDKLITLEDFSPNHDNIINIIAGAKEWIKQLLVKRIRKIDNRILEFLVSKYSDTSSLEKAANIFVSDSYFDTDESKWNDFILMVDYFKHIDVPRFVQKLKNDLENMPINLLMFVKDDMKRQSIAAGISKICIQKKIPLPYSLSLLCFMSDQSVSNFIDKLEREEFDKESIKQLLSVGVDHETSEDLSRHMSNPTLKKNREILEKKVKAAEYALQHMSEDKIYDKQTVKELIEAIKSNSMRAIKRLITA